jgi:hypothetical protein
MFELSFENEIMGYIDYDFANNGYDLLNYHFDFVDIVKCSEQCISGNDVTVFRNFIKKCFYRIELEQALGIAV